MDKNDLYKSSPIRFFEAASNGGLKEGELGLVTAKKGLGKTSVLVQFGMDALLAGNPLVHVSFDQHSSNVISWYSSVFIEIAKKKNISNASELKDEIMRDRTILNFNQESFTLPKVINTIGALKSGGINVKALVIDGLDLDKISKNDIAAVADFAKDEKITVWFSDTKESNKLLDSVRSEIVSYFAVVAHIEAAGGNLSLNVLKEHSNENVGSVNLDSKTMLMTK